MIPDNQTNFVYFSALLPKWYQEEFRKIEAILKKHDIKYGLLNGTKDIWCRDYMPVQISETEFVQFRYDPSYLESYKELESKSDPKLVNFANIIKPMYSAINLDGGNVVRYEKRAFITARVFKENLDMGMTDAQIKEKLSTDLNAEIIIIPEHPKDTIDHADGNIRCLSDDKVLVNNLSSEYSWWKNSMLKLEKENHLEFIQVPWFIPTNRKTLLSAVGIYINYLEVDNLIILPKFEIAGNKDKEAFEIFQQEIFPKKVIEQVNINSIAEEGGLLNCISWNIKMPNL